MQERRFSRAELAEAHAGHHAHRELKCNAIMFTADTEGQRTGEFDSDGSQLDFQAFRGRTNSNSVSWTLLMPRRAIVADQFVVRCALSWLWH